MQAEALLYARQHLFDRVLSSTPGPLRGGGTERRQVGVTGGGGVGGCAGQKESVRERGTGGRRGGSSTAESSWAPRAASFCWAARPVLIPSWSRSRRRRPTRRCPCGSCTGCCRTSSWSGSGRCPWPFPEHGLRRADRKQRDQNPVFDEAAGRRVSVTHPAAPTARSASSGRRCPAGGCGSSASCTGCTRWPCLGFVLEKPVVRHSKKLAQFMEENCHNNNDRFY